MTSKQWAEKVQVSDLYGSMWADVIADLAAAEERADGMERAGAEQARRADDNAAKLEECQKELGEWMKSHVEICEQKERQEKFTEINRQAWIALAAKLEALRPYLRHHKECVKGETFVTGTWDDHQLHTIGCTCGLDALMGGGK